MHGVRKKKDTHASLKNERTWNKKINKELKINKIAFIFFLFLITKFPCNKFQDMHFWWKFIKSSISLK